MITCKKQQNVYLCVTLNSMELDFKKLDGLIPAIIQNDHDKTVLMVGFMNEDAYKKTQESGYVYFWSRTRQSLWMKGETSGNRLKVISLATDCDNDTLLASVKIEGDGVCCHTGSKSCFFRKMEFSDL